MNPLDKAILERFKALVSRRFQLHKVLLFGSRARGDADPQSDMDVVVILEVRGDGDAKDYVAVVPGRLALNTGSLWFRWSSVEMSGSTVRSAVLSSFRPSRQRECRCEG